MDIQFANLSGDYVNENLADDKTINEDTLRGMELTSVKAINGRRANAMILESVE